MLQDGRWSTTEYSLFILLVPSWGPISHLENATSLPHIELWKLLHGKIIIAWPGLNGSALLKTSFCQFSPLPDHCHVSCNMFNKKEVSWVMGVPPGLIHLDRDFPWNKPTSEKGVPPWLWKPPNRQVVKNCNGQSAIRYTDCLVYDPAEQCRSASSNWIYLTTGTRKYISTCVGY